MFEIQTWNEHDLHWETVETGTDEVLINNLLEELKETEHAVRKVRVEVTYVEGDNVS